MLIFYKKKGGLGGMEFDEMNCVGLLDPQNTDSAILLLSDLEG